MSLKKKKDSDPSLLVIPLRDIVAANPVTENNVVVQIDFARRDSPTSAMLSEDSKMITNSIRFDMDRKEISSLLVQIEIFKDEKLNPSISRAIAVVEHPNLCIQCAKKKRATLYRHDYNLCKDCFTSNYGKPILEVPNAEYYGGHKAYLSGGYFDKFQIGRLILSEYYLIFATEHKDPFDIQIACNTCDKSTS